MDIGVEEEEKISFGLSLDSIEEEEGKKRKTPTGQDPTPLHSYVYYIREQFGCQRLEDSYWVIVRNSAIPGTEGQKLPSQVHIGKKVGYNVAKTRAVVLNACMTERLCKKRLYEDVAVRCAEKVGLVSDYMITSSSYYPIIVKFKKEGIYIGPGENSINFFEGLAGTR